MQIDFHHAVTYILARIAGFDVKQAEIIAYAAQYVDDATNAGTIRFNRNIYYSRISSAHRLIDPRNFRALSNLKVWIPFHFLPGNSGKPSSEYDPANTDEKITAERLRCTPDSYVSKDMIASCLEDYGKPYALHRLGITLHVYADTFAHQGFAGVSHQCNEVKEFSGDLEPRKILDVFKDTFVNFFIESVLPLGHGAVLSYPDLPFARWHYKNDWLESKHKTAEGDRENPVLFIDAVKAVFNVLTAYRKKFTANNEPVPENIPGADLEVIEANLRAFTNHNKDDRHRQWLESIRRGDFSFAPEGTECPLYVHKGIGSWKYEALGTEKETDTKNDIYDFEKSFLYSDWKLFHDALQKHRFAVLRDILPRYGICGA